jgi:hypothetical protein
LNFRADQNLLYLKARPQRAVELRRRGAKSLRCEPCFAVAAASRRERLRSRSSLAFDLFDLGEECCAARVHPETVGSKRRECGSLSRLSDSTNPVKWAMRLPAYQLPLQADLARPLPRPSGTGAVEAPRFSLFGLVLDSSSGHWQAALLLMRVPESGETWGILVPETQPGAMPARKAHWHCSVWQGPPGPQGTRSVGGHWHLRWHRPRPRAAGSNLTNLRRLHWRSGWTQKLSLRVGNRGILCAVYHRCRRLPVPKREHRDRD